MMSLKMTGRRSDILGLVSCRYFSQKKDLYKIMELENSASAKEIKGAYYKLSKSYHPDSTSSSTDSAGKFHDLTAAYEVLGNSDKRRDYDRAQSINKTREMFRNRATSASRNVKWTSPLQRTADDTLDIDYEHFVKFQKEWRKKGLKNHQSHVPPEFGGGYPFESFYRPPGAGGPEDPFIRETFDEKMRRWDEEIQKRARPKPFQSAEPDLNEVHGKKREKSQTVGAFLAIRIFVFLILCTGGSLCRDAYLDYVRVEKDMAEKRWHK